MRERKSPPPLSPSSLDSRSLLPRRHVVHQRVGLFARHALGTADRERHHDRSTQSWFIPHPRRSLTRANALPSALTVEARTSNWYSLRCAIALPAENVRQRRAFWLSQPRRLDRDLGSGRQVSRQLRGEGMDDDQGEYRFPRKEKCASCTELPSHVATGRIVRSARARARRTVHGRLARRKVRADQGRIRGSER